jgi:hypothetical protein
MSHALRSKHRTGSEFVGDKTKGYSSSRAASKGNDAGVMNGVVPPMMMHGYPMGGVGGPAFMGGPGPAMMMGGMMGMGHHPGPAVGGVGGPGMMMGNPMFHFEMQRAFFAQQEHMMQAHHHQRMWQDQANGGGGPVPAASPEATGKAPPATGPGGGPAVPSPGGAAAKVPETTKTEDV